MRTSQASGVGTDPWANGLAHNRKNLERFIQYAWDQGLIERHLAVEVLFHETTHGTVAAALLPRIDAGRHR